jgi:hypothetical protein
VADFHRYYSADRWRHIESHFDFDHGVNERCEDVGRSRLDGIIKVFEGLYYIY